MTCPTITSHEWDEPTLAGQGRHDIRGLYQEWRRTCQSCGKVQTWREWPKEQAEGLTRLNPLNETRDW